MRYAAIGDSYTEGVGDELPDGSTRGWADRVAAGLAATRGEPVLYANLAVRGRRLEPIATDQLDAALALDPAPTLLTLNGGGNDMLRPRTDVARLVDLTARAVRRATAAGVRLVLVSGADPSAGIPFGAAVRRRGEELTAGVAELAAAHGVTFVDVFHDAEVRRPVHWAPDRLHLGPAGHRHVAGLVLDALGEGAAAEAVQEDAPEVRRLLAELRYYREHVLPWVRRRLTGRSSGDGRTGKHPLWVPVPPGAAGPDGAGAADLVLRPVGRVASPLVDRADAPKQGDEGAPDAWLELDPSTAPALRGLEPGADVVVLTWLHRARRDVLLTHPRDDPARPATGVFGTRSPDRPNPVGLHTVRVLAVEGTRVRVRGLEAVDGTPVLDVKPVLRPVGER